MKHLTFVKKIQPDGNPCPKCMQVEERLDRAGFLQRIDDIVIAREDDPQSPGALLAAKHGVHQAPFFIVTDDSSGELQHTIYTVYFAFVKAAFQPDNPNAI
ncbi:MAG: hypothetical protein P8I46_07455 [Pseudomonadales bacterium]|nr:hypothetical protein [Pseudomonadales bacterium]